MSPSQEKLVVEVRFKIEKDAEGYPKSRDSEALLCKPLNPDCSLCVVDSVPFYLRDVAYGDTISTNYDPAGYLKFAGIIKRGGYSVYRIFLHDPLKKGGAIKKLLKSDAIVEQDGNLIAFAIPPTAKAETIVTYVLDGKSKGFWGAQDGYIFKSP